MGRGRTNDMSRAELAAEIERRFAAIDAVEGAGGAEQSDEAEAKPHPAQADQGGVLRVLKRIRLARVGRGGRGRHVKNRPGWEGAEPGRCVRLPLSRLSPAPRTPEPVWDSSTLRLRSPSCKLGPRSWCKMKPGG